MKKKGFTLVELLATIVVLSVIALIATPIILNVIEKAKKGALVSSVNGLVESANMYYTNEIIKGDINENVIFDFEEGIQTSESKLSYKGKVYNGKLILTSDSDVITCIDDGKYYAYKEKDSDEVISGIGTCLYDGTTGDFTIESDVDVIIKECDEDKKELQEQITNLTTTVNNLQNEVNEKEYEISNLESVIEGLENQVTVLEGEKEDLLKQIENSNTSNSELLDKINELNNEITTLKGTIDSLNSEITVLEGEKEELTNQLALSNTNNTELQNKITNLNKEITSLKETISNNETTITNLTTEKNNLTNELTQANNDKTTLQNQINELNGTIATLESSIEAKDNEIKTLNGEKKALQTSLDTKTAELKTLNENLGKVTATASDVLKGKTILTSSGLVTGSMTNNGSISKTLNAGGSYTIPKGYHDGTGKVTANTLASQTKVDSGKTAISASQVLSGYQGWVNGSKVTGTMVNYANQTLTSNTVTESGDNILINIPSSGYYSTNSKISVTSDEIISNLNNYSEDETIIGTWIDGKPLYRISGVFKMPIVDTQGVHNTIGYDIAKDVDIVVDISGTAINNKGNAYNPLPSTNIPAGTNTVTYIHVWYNVYENKLYLRSSRIDHSGTDAYITMYYTKTTD